MAPYRGELVNVLFGRPQGGESDLLRKLGELRVREHGRVTQEVMNYISERGINCEELPNQRNLPFFGQKLANPPPPLNADIIYVYVYMPPYSRLRRVVRARGVSHILCAGEHAERQAGQEVARRHQSRRRTKGEPRRL